MKYVGRLKNMIKSYSQVFLLSRVLHLELVRVTRNWVTSFLDRLTCLKSKMNQLKPKTKKCLGNEQLAKMVSTKNVFHLMASWWIRKISLHIWMLKTISDKKKRKKGSSAKSF